MTVVQPTPVSGRITDERWSAQVVNVCDQLLVVTAHTVVRQGERVTLSCEVFAVATGASCAVKLPKFAGNRYSIDEEHKVMLVATHDRLLVCSTNLLSTVFCFAASGALLWSTTIDWDGPRWGKEEFPVKVIFAQDASGIYIVPIRDSDDLVPVQDSGYGQDSDDQDAHFVPLAFHLLAHDQTSDAYDYGYSDFRLVKK
eukprot:TRINITY_DN29213_c0_g1_i1.p1 TRINITY_DN29213_c0_g1~~TRINITY_DN29213_c0_g1_i1.p1  ORF type:complete len:199 (-),score=3.60 TRINITY_DN29213_c0_g1_i1:86-682(-)